MLLTILGIQLSALNVSMLQMKEKLTQFPSSLFGKKYPKMFCAVGRHQCRILLGIVYEAIRILIVTISSNVMHVVVLIITNS